MKLTKPTADVYVPDGMPMPEALSRTTHLSVGAHSDDQEYMAFHGIAECFGRGDKWFTGVCGTNGGGSARSGIYAGYTDEDMIEVRKREQIKAAFVGEYACEIQLMYLSSEIKDPAGDRPVADLRAIFETAQAEIVYLHNPADKHDTHVALFLRCLQALRALPTDQRPTRVYGCEVWRDLDWMHDPDKLVMPLDGHDNIAASLAGIFDSQIRGGKRYHKAIEGRRTANATFFESHATDQVQALNLAMDLTPLIRDDGVSVADFTLGLLQNFETDVMNRIAKYS